MDARKNAKKPNIQTQYIVDLYRQGLSALQIGKKLGLNKSSIIRRLNKSGEPKRKSADYSDEKRYWLWKGPDHISPITRKRNKSRHRVWSHAVLERDNFICQDCGVKNIRLHAHHLVSLRECINTHLEFAVDNGIALCVPCHGKRHTIGNRH